MRFSCRYTCSASGPITGWCSNTVCRPTTARSVDANAAATFRLCGTACCTQAGHSIWHACRNTTRPRRDCRDGAPSALNQRATVHSGAIGGDASAIDGPVATRFQGFLPQIPDYYCGRMATTCELRQACETP